jgi:protoheme IX farnesyltransferase
MLPVVAGEAATRRQILLYTLLLALSSFAPVALGFGHWLYLATAVIGSGMMLRWSWMILRAATPEADRKACWSMFGGSILYLFALFAALLVERIVFLLLPVLSRLTEFGA